MNRYSLTKLHSTDRRYVLREDGRDHGYLDFEGFCGTAAQAVVQERAWTFRRSGVFKPVVIVHRAGEADELLVAPIRFAGGCDATIDGQTFQWKPTAVLRGEHAWVDSAGHPVIRSVSRLSLGTVDREVEVLSGALSAETRDLLVLLAGYLLVLQSYDVAATTAAVLAATASV